MELDDRLDGGVWSGGAERKSEPADGEVCCFLLVRDGPLGQLGEIFRVVDCRAVPGGLHFDAPWFGCESGAETLLTAGELDVEGVSVEGLEDVGRGGIGRVKLAVDHHETEPGEGAINARGDAGLLVPVAEALEDLRFLRG